MDSIKFLKENPDIAKQVRFDLSGEDLLSLIESIKKQLQPIISTQINPTQVDDKLINIDEVADIFGVSRVTLWQWGKKGILTPVKIGHIVRYKSSEIKKVMNSLKPQINKGR